MKNFKTGLVIGIAMLIIAGCEDFLEIRPEGTLPTTGIDYTKSENIFLSVSAAYASMRSYGAHEFPYIGAFEITSDNADKGSSAEDNPPTKELDNFSFTSSNGTFNDLWKAYYDMVSAANYSIHQMPLFVANLNNQENKAYALQCQGESKFIRAYAYFNLTRMFGRVPIYDTITTEAILASTKQSETAKLYEFIEKDLTEAIAVLPASYTKEWAGRATKYTAMALKAKVHLYQSEWDSAAYHADKVMASGQFELLPDFREVFLIDGENSKESLFEIQASTLGQSSGEKTYMEYAYQQGPRGNSPGNMQGWGFCTPSQNLIDFFTARGETVRAQTTFLYRGTITPEGDSIKNSCTNPVYNGKVYTPSSQNKWNYNGYGFDYNVRILRYSEVLLIFAEAMANGASITPTSGYTAFQALNEVRHRAQLPDAPATIENIWDERRAELALEEDRFFDLIRTGRAKAALAAHGKNFIEGKHEHFPIPADQMKLNANLVQNNGY